MLTAEQIREKIFRAEEFREYCRAKGKSLRQQAQTKKIKDSVLIMAQKERKIKWEV